MAIRTAPSITVTGANTATALSATSVPCHSIILSSTGGNTAPIFYGDSNVSSTPGAERGAFIASGGSATLTEESSPDGFNLKQVYIASTSATAKIYIAYTEA